MELQEVINDILAVIPAIDADPTLPINPDYLSSIGTLAEDGFRDAVDTRLRAAHPEKYAGNRVEVCYPNNERAKCDLCLGAGEPLEWAVELKKVAFVGDNGNNNDFGPSKVVSPYPIHRSSVLDAERLLRDKPAPRGAILMYGFDFDPTVVTAARTELTARGLPQTRASNLAGVVARNGGPYLVGPTFQMFELISQMSIYGLGPRAMGNFAGLSSHPIYRKGWLAAWEILPRGAHQSTLH